MMVYVFFSLLGAVALLVMAIVLKSVYLVKQSTVIVIERLGKFKHVLHPGLHMIIPFIDNPRYVQWSYLGEDSYGRRIRLMRSTYSIDLRESVYDFPKQNVITKDNVTMEINALLYYQITDAKAAIYEIDNLAEGIEKLTQTTLRNVIGSMDLDETLVSRDDINTRLRIILDEATDKWGVKVNRVELQEVNPPADIRHAMEKQMRAERDRRAVILEAEGSKKSAILKAEGARESAVLKAQGEAESRIIAAESKADARLKIAQAEALALEQIAKTLPKGSDPAQYLIAMQYMKTLPKMTDAADKLVVLPYEASNLMGSLSGIKEIFNHGK